MTLHKSAKCKFIREDIIIATENELSQKSFYTNHIVNEALSKGIAI